MQQASSTSVSETKETPPAPKDDRNRHVKQLLLKELSPMRGKHIDLQKLVNEQSVYIKRLARECSRTREHVNDLTSVLNKERYLRRDIQHNFSKLHTQVAKLKSYASTGQYII